MKNIEEMKRQVEEMPANQWFRMNEITGGEHSPGLWQHLCIMDDGLHVRRSDGALFVANEVRLSFMWKKAE